MSRSNGKSSQSDTGSQTPNNYDSNKPVILITSLIRLKMTMLMLLLFISHVTAQNELKNPCSDKFDRAIFCQPNLINIANRHPVLVSSLCQTEQGDTIDCDPSETGRSAARKNCSQPLCPPTNNLSEDVKTEYLTDTVTNIKKTCWVSKPLRDLKASYVNFTINLKKKYLINYMSLSDCHHPLPDKVEILKSVDFGTNWQRLHLFSRNCELDFGIAGKPYLSSDRIDAREVVCTKLSDFDRDRYDSGGIIKFSTDFNRLSTSVAHKNDPLITDWMTATDIKIVMHLYTDSTDLDRRMAFSDIEIGGRCFCNGHASSCSQADGRITCDCQHGTEGTDCERCQPFWVDLPWVRSTPIHPSQCKRCNCNLHSRNCAFDRELYSLSPLEGGGMCLNCQHRTAGRHCQYCKEGYHRNWVLPDTHEQVCQPCMCHPLGMRTNVCNPKNGKCYCKSGVTGEKCDWCKKGYAQTLLSQSPCFKDGASSTPSKLGAAVTMIKNRDIHFSAKRNRQMCSENCRSKERILTHMDYCLRQWAIKVQVTSRRDRRHKQWIKISAKIEHVFKYRSGMPTVVNFWIRRRQWRCGCLKMKANKMYLIITRDKRHPTFKTDLVLDRKSIVWEWKNNLFRKIHEYDKFLGLHNKNCRDCDCLLKNANERQNLYRKSDADKKKHVLNAEVSIASNTPTFDETNNAEYRIKTSSVRDIYPLPISPNTRASYNRAAERTQRYRYSRLNFRTNGVEDDISLSRAYSNFGDTYNGNGDNQIQDIS